MITATLIAFAVLLGYFVTVGLSMAVTFSFTRTAPGFVVKDHLLRTRYKLFQALVWLMCVIVGSFLSALLAELVQNPWLVGALFATVLILVLWGNTWEARQRGLWHQLFLSALTGAGVGAGYYLALH